MSDDTPSPIWIRDAVVSDYTATARRNGSTASSAQIEAIALEDLRITDAVARDNVARPKPAPAPRAANGMTTRSNRDAAQSGLQAYRGPIVPRQRQADPSAFLDAAPTDLKYAAMIARVAKILEPRSLFRPSQENDYAIPALAAEYIQEYTDLKRGTRAYRGLSAVDCRRRFRARVESICDRSTGKLGPWWVR